MKFARKISVMMMMIVVTTVAAACGGGGSGTGGTGAGGDAAAVEAAARQVYTALSSFDFEALRPLVCTEQRAGIDTAIEEMGGEAGLTAMREMMGDMAVDISGVTFTVTNLTADSADVAASGEISITAGGETFTEPAGDGEVARFVREDGQWRFCEDLGI